MNKQKFYQKIEFLGEGQYANVYKAKDVRSSQIVAIKKIKLGDRYEAADGINRTALREIKILQELSHPNLLTLLDVYGHRSDISLVFDFMDTDLHNIIKDPQIVLKVADIKQFTIQTLKGLEYLHANFVLHRDLKPDNLLLNAKGNLKIGDFGLAKFFGNPNRLLTPQVVTRWYRAPELLFGARIYSSNIDMWAIGCIIAEMMIRRAIFPGEADIDQLAKIFDILGRPTRETWPGVEKLPDYLDFTTSPTTSLESCLSGYPKGLCTQWSVFH